MKGYVLLVYSLRQYFKYYAVAGVVFHTAFYKCLFFIYVQIRLNMCWKPAGMFTKLTWDYGAS